MSTPEHWRNAVAGATKFVAPALARAVSVVVVFRAVGADVFGVYSLAVASVSLVTASQVGIAAGVIETVSASGESASDGRRTRSELGPALFSGLMLAVVAVGIIGGLLCLLMVVGLEGIGVPTDLTRLGRGIFMLVALSGAASVLTSPFIGLYEGLQRYGASARLVSARSVLGMFADISIVLAGGGILTLLFVRLVIDVLILAISTRTKLFLGSSVIPRPDVTVGRIRTRLVRMADYALNLSVGGFFSSLMWRGTYFLVGRFLGPSTLGLFSLVNELAIRAHQLVASSSEFLFPVTRRAIADETEGELLKVLAAAYTVAMVVGWPLATALSLFSSPIVIGIAGQWVQPGLLPLLRWAPPVFILSYYLHGISGIEYAVVNGYRKPAVNRNYNLVLAIVVLAATYAGVRIFGVSGVLLAGVSLGLGSVAFIAVVARTICVRPLQFFMPALETTTVATIVAATSLFLIQRFDLGAAGLIAAAVGVVAASYSCSVRRGYLNWAALYDRVREVTRGRQRST